MKRIGIVALVVVVFAILAQHNAKAEIAGRCPEKAPVGSEFIRTVHLWGIPYDLYRVRRADGADDYVQVYC
ncbi:hypothetical protein Ssi03_48750 [Sphaerisporangium siamense]|uniref:Uncharacterized protein n=1 Tax=Sphaerisporangium siamense TaxID=795645 RepID=A0A7W7G6F2_9ACTN|nr:hypothetical protein [Sphaerisporangium siamense]MBB4699473.1 hypothetical protein [Sphaerisporangium siamense]GII86885.1 hypothetical protein Ssi03_48750 [Sphaerisporangium siamense]